MNKTYNDKTINKRNAYVKKWLPECTSKFFKTNIGIMIKKYSNAVLGNDEHLTPEAIHRSFRNKIFIQSGNNIPMTSEICGISQATLRQYYSYLDE